jgi:predicted MPP superfamily phosphohydrolase
MAEALVSALLFIGAVVGHGAILVCVLNRVYARPWRRPLLRAIKFTILVLALTGPVALALVFGFHLAESWPRAWTQGPFVPAAYVLLCWLAAFVVLPIETFKRLLAPRVLPRLSNHTQTIDVAQRLGQPPLGRHGKLRRLATLPGNQVFRVDFTEKTFEIAGLPAAWDGLTILHLTDLHLKGCPDRDFFRHVMDVCNEQPADLVAVTGDIVDSHKHHRWVVPVLGRLKYQVAAFAVLGNHDLWHEPGLTRRRLQKIRFKHLDNCWERLEVRGEPMIVIGHEGPWFGAGPDLSQCPRGLFRLGLTHTPDNIDWAREHQVDLLLAGHNHGGQIRIPPFGSLFVPSKYGRRFDAGSFHEPPTLLHVGRGLSGQEPLRYFCKPEVTRIVLRSR